MRRILYVLATSCSLLLSAGAAHAVVLDWSTVAWTAGATTGGANLDPTLPGNEVTVDLTGDLNRLTSDPVSGSSTPAVLTTFQGGLTSADHSLHVFVNAGTKTEITVTITFSASYALGANNVSFTLFDIDKGVDNEFIKNIRGTAVDGSQVAPSISGLGSAVSLSGTGVAQLLTGNVASPNTGAGSGNGNATISFGSTSLRSLAFAFDNSNGAPRLQEFGLYDLSFTPVPEANPAAGFAALCVAASFYAWRRRKIL